MDNTDKAKKQVVAFKNKQSQWGSHSKEGGRHANEDRHVAITKENMWLILEKARLKANKEKERETRREAKRKLTGKTGAPAPAPPATEPKPASPPEGTTLITAAPSARSMLTPAKKRSQVFEGAQFPQQVLEKVASQIQFGAGVFAVYDGHGGKKTVNYLKKHLHKNIINQETRHLFFVNNESEIDELGIVKAIYRGFKATEKQIMQMLPRRDESGSCAVVIIQLHSLLFVANLGDSRAVVARERAKATIVPPDSPPTGPLSTSLPSSLSSGSGNSPPFLSSFSPPRDGVGYESKYKALALTKDHKAIDPKEMKRIYANGGWVSFNRVFGIIAVSRSFGDMLVKGQQPQLQNQNADKPTSALGKQPLSPRSKRKKLLENKDASTTGNSPTKKKLDGSALPKSSGPRPGYSLKDRKRSKSTDNARAFAADTPSNNNNSNNSNNSAATSPKKEEKKRRKEKEKEKEKEAANKDADLVFMVDDNDFLGTSSSNTSNPDEPALPGEGKGHKSPELSRAKRDDGDEVDSIRLDDEMDDVDHRGSAAEEENPLKSPARKHKRSASLNLKTRPEPPPPPSSSSGSGMKGSPPKPFRTPRESHSDSEAEEVPDKGWVKFIKDSASKAKKASGKASKEWLWDQAAKAPPGVVIATPVVKIFRRKPEDKFLLMASDGLWDVMTNAQAIDFVQQRLKAKQEKSKNKTLTRSDLNDICKHLCKRAKQLGSLDDITSLLVLLE